MTIQLARIPVASYVDRYGLKIGRALTTIERQAASERGLAKKVEDTIRARGLDAHARGLLHAAEILRVALDSDVVGQAEEGG